MFFAPTARLHCGGCQWRTPNHYQHLEYITENKLLDPLIVRMSSGCFNQLIIIINALISQTFLELFFGPEKQISEWSGSRFSGGSEVGWIALWQEVFFFLSRCPSVHCSLITHVVSWWLLLRWYIQYSIHVSGCVELQTQIPVNFRLSFEN